MKRDVSAPQRTTLKITARDSSLDLIRFVSLVEGGDFCPKNVELMDGIGHLPATPTPTKDSPWSRTMAEMMSPPYNTRGKFGPKNPDLMESIAHSPSSKEPNRSPMMSPSHHPSGFPQRSPFAVSTLGYCRI